jgi:hypothetical protein
MELVNPMTAYPIGSRLENINSIFMRGIPEKQGWAFSAYGYRENLKGVPDPDVLGVLFRRARRPLSLPTLGAACRDYAERRAGVFPRYFIIEPTAVCNRACPFCSILVTNRTGMMEWDHFTKLMDECSKHVVYGLSLYQLGEPFLWHGKYRDGFRLDIANMVDYAKRVGGFQVVNLSTNGDVQNLNRVLGSQLDDLIISIDGTTAEVYDANRPRTKPNDTHAFERTLERVRAFLAKKIAGFSRPCSPWVRLQIINKANTAGQVLDFVRTWIGVPGVDDVLVKNLDSMRPWLGSAVVGDEEDAVKARALGAMPCQHLYSIGSMTVDGRFNACCHDARTELTDGATIDTMTFAEWWNGDYMTGLRRAHEAGEFNAVCAACRERDTWLG